MSEPEYTANDPPVEAVEQPLPDSVMNAVVNPLMTRLLRSPLHSLVSDSILLLTVTGRKTGTEYTTPVAYEQRGETLLVTTHHSTWWKNLKGGAPVTVTLRGDRREGYADVTTDPDEVAAYLHDYLDRHGRDHAGRLGVSIEGETLPSQNRFRSAAEDVILVRIDLDANGEESGD